MTHRFFKGVLASTALAAAALASTSAQAATASASASAVILEQVVVTKTSDLNFGTIAIGTGGGTVTMGFTSNRTCGTGLVCSGVVTSGAFNIQGAGNQNVGINSDSSVTLTRVSGTETMSASLTRSASTATLTALGAGSFQVGGVLTVGGTQVAGAYTGTFNVTVNYQ